MSSVTEWASWYAASGLKVFPCDDQKHPITKNGVHDATDQVAKVNFWFRHYRNAWVAIATGHALRSGGFLVVFDVDVDEDTNGDVSIAEIEAAHGELPRTWTARTPRGGWHYYFRSPEPPKCRVKFRDGLDTRGVGGYVIAPPSPGYKLELRAGLADAPAWLLPVICPPPPSWDSPPADRRPASSRYVEAAIGRECDKLASTPTGCRNDQLNRSAFALARFVAAGEADPETVIEALASAAAYAGLSEREITRTIESAFGARGVAA